MENNIKPPCRIYLDGNRWKINSGITKVDTDELNYIFHGLYGSSYICGKNNQSVLMV
jgi:hypothetical protein